MTTDSCNVSKGVNGSGGTDGSKRKRKRVRKRIREINWRSELIKNNAEDVEKLAPRSTTTIGEEGTSLQEYSDVKKKEDIDSNNITKDAKVDVDVDVNAKRHQKTRKQRHLSAVAEGSPNGENLLSFKLSSETSGTQCSVASIGKRAETTVTDLHAKGQKKHRKKEARLLANNEDTSNKNVLISLPSISLVSEVASKRKSGNLCLETDIQASSSQCMMDDTIHNHDINVSPGNLRFLETKGNNKKKIISHDGEIVKKRKRREKRKQIDMCLLTTSASEARVKPENPEQGSMDSVERTNHSQPDDYSEERTNASDHEKLVHAANSSPAQVVSMKLIEERCRVKNEKRAQKPFPRGKRNKDGKKQNVCSPNQATDPSEGRVLLSVSKQADSVDQMVDLNLHPSSSIRRKLLIIDVNGVLADLQLIYKGDKADARIRRKFVFKRPFLDGFLDFCFRRFDVGVWSSAMKKNLDPITKFLLGSFISKLLFCWDGSLCSKGGINVKDNLHKPLVLKDLKKIWKQGRPDVPWEHGYYDAENTLLLDDSPYKSLCNPPHNAVFPHPYSYEDGEDNALGPGGAIRNYLEGLYLADNVPKYVEENPFGQQPISKEHPDWNYYERMILDNGF